MDVTVCLPKVLGNTEVHGVLARIASSAGTRRRLVSVSFLLLSLPVSGAGAGVAVVVSAKSAVTHLTPQQVSDIYLGKVDAFPGGGSATPIDQSEGRAIRDEFYATVLNKSAAQVAAYWAKVIFTGEGTPPRTLGNSAAVKQAVAGDPNAIGYIDDAAVDGSVRIVLATRPK